MNTTLEKRFAALVDSAKYDVSCASSGSSRGNVKGKLGTTEGFGICHSWGADGRCISLLKILQTNNCLYDCAYCVNRRSNDIPRAGLSPREIAEITLNFYKRNYIEGLFLSSAIVRSVDYTMEMMVRSIELLRTNYCFNGYIHIKGIPGADRRLLRKAGELADRLSVNIELPSEKSLSNFAPDKTKTAILGSMKNLTKAIALTSDNKKRFRKVPDFLPAGQSTQLIVGASPESDRHIISLSESLYQKFGMRRVYYSAYVPVGTDKRLPACEPPLRREHRLYQADWLLRFYGFKAGEILQEENPNFDINLDPKTHWALCNLHHFPVEINTVDYPMLLRVPGIGVRSAQKIFRSRKHCRLTFDDLKKMGIVLKRAQFFITASGKHFLHKEYDIPTLRMMLSDNSCRPQQKEKQLLLFDKPQPLLTQELVFSALTGEV